MTTIAGPCPTCHEPHPWPWLGHHPVSSGHPEDDDPWCKHCGHRIADMHADDPLDYCPAALDGPEPDDGWTDQQLAADDARARARLGDNPNDHHPGTPMPAPLEWL